MSRKQPRETADGVLKIVRERGKIKAETLAELLALLAKTDYGFHIAVEVRTGSALKTIDNEQDALETIERLRLRFPT